MRAPERKTSFIAQQIEKLQKNYAIMVGLILLFVVAVVWMIVSIVQVEDTSDLTKRAQKNTTQLNPNLDRTTLELVANKHYYSEEELTNFPIFVLIEDKDGNFQVVSIEDVAERLEELRSDSATTPTQQPETPTPPSLPSTTPTPAPTVASVPIVVEEE